MTELGKVKGSVRRKKASKWWYGRYQLDGKRKEVSLHVAVEGTPPAEGEEYGNRQYETSKKEAEIALRRVLEDVVGNKSAEELAQTVYKARAGQRVKLYDLSDLPKLWREKPRAKTVSSSHRKICLSQIQSFLEYCEKNLPAVTKLDHLTRDHAKQFMAWQEGRGISPRTWNAIMATLRTACRQGNCKAFDSLVQRTGEMVHRIPYSPEELKDIITEAKKDDLLYPLVVTAVCSAMRKGDCCKLAWSAVDLDEGFLTVKTSKTGRMADIPISPLLREVIVEQLGNGSEYVYPDLAAQYESNPKMLTDRLRKVLASAGFRDGDATVYQELDAYDPKVLEKKAQDYFRTISHATKREKVQAMFVAYTGGKSLCKSAEEVGISKSTASMYLNEIEAAAGIAFIRGKRRKNEAPVPKRGDVHLERKQGVRRASLRDFHSFRTTWITLALCSGIPFELVTTVTGHATAEVVLQNYFKPQRAQLKAALEKSMPDLLTAESNKPEDLVPNLLRSMTAENWESVRDEALIIYREAGYDS